ncbi:MAG: hypothetical protein R8L53_08400 [Mariprofundales bacterium]
MSIEALLPHRTPMLMISDIVTKGDTKIHCRACIKKDNPFLNEGILPSFICLELVAQAAGIFLGIDALEHSNIKLPDSGAIVSVRDMNIHAQAIRLGMVLDVTANFLGGNQQAAMFSGQVLFDNCLLFEIKVTIALFNHV